MPDFRYCHLYWQFVYTPEERDTPLLRGGVADGADRPLSLEDATAAAKNQVAPTLKKLGLDFDEKCLFLTPLEWGQFGMQRKVLEIW